MKFWFAFFTISSFQDCETAMVGEKWNFRNSEIFEEEIFKNVKTANKRWCCILVILTSSSAKMYSSELGGVRRLKYGMAVPSSWSNLQQYLNDDIIQTIQQPLNWSLWANTTYTSDNIFQIITINDDFCLVIISEWGV